MATATPTRPTFNRAETDRRVRHPLHALRGYIRRYVTLEGAGVAIVYLALWFWIGLALDYGLFKITQGYDWIQELQNLSGERRGVSPTWTADLIVRGVILGLLAAGLLAVVAVKVLLRLFREFRDSSLALVLERRFPKDLGDRVITAVEMADPKLAPKYGFSQALIDKTIQDAADRVEQVPVRQVFNWGRLGKLAALCAGLTLGLYLLVGIGYLGISWLAFRDAHGNSASPVEYFWRFNHVAGIWTERNILLMDSYWPRQAYLELVRFQDTEDHRGEMRVGRDESRPDLQVRAFQWMVADRQAPGGWRPMLWRDLAEFIEPELLKKVNIPNGWPGWQMDPDDADVRNWHDWTVDRLASQEKTVPVRQALHAQLPEAHQALEQVLARLEELAGTVTMERRLRKLTLPEFAVDESEEDRSIVFQYWGKNIKRSSGPDRAGSNNSFYFGLGELKESVQFTIKALDFSTPVLRIQLVPPPGIVELHIDKEEPAYIYYRLRGAGQAASLSSQKPLKGYKQVFKNVAVSVTGESSVIQVPLGSNLTLTAAADRPLKKDVRMARPATTEERGAIAPTEPVTLHDDQKTFAASFKNVVKTIEFNFEFADLDSVRGKRRVLIRPIDDRAPEVFDVEMTAALRKPRFKAEPGKSTQGTPADGFLITPDALIPFKGTLRDDYGLTQAHWHYDVEPVEIELVGKPGAKDMPTLVLQGNTQLRRNALVASGMQFVPGLPGQDAVVPIYWAWVNRMMALDLALSAKRFSQEGAEPMERFELRLEERSVDELTLDALKERLALRGRQYEKPPQRGLFREHSLKEEDGFDFKRYLPKLKVQDATKEAQLHYLARLSVSATDNNVETGPSVGKNKAPFTFLVVSENELLSQIFLEEELLRDRLEKAVTKLKNARTSIDEQAAKLSSPGTELSLVGIRVEEVRKAVSDTASTTREVHGDFSRIVRELEVNRVGFDKDKRKINDVQKKIVEPLEEVINPNFGNFATTEEGLADLAKKLEDDIIALRQAETDKTQSSITSKLEANLPGHVKNAQAVRDRLDSLIDRLNAVLLTMEEQFVYGQLLQLIVEIERGVRGDKERLELYKRRMEEDILKGLFK